MIEEQFGDIGPHGTKIVVFNLWSNDNGVLELDFDSKEEVSIRCLYYLFNYFLQLFVLFEVAVIIMNFYFPLTRIL